MGESSTFIPSWSEVRTNTSDFRTNTSDFRISPSDLCRYRPILRPISFIVRYYHSHQIHSFILISFSSSVTSCLKKLFLMAPVGAALDFSSRNLVKYFFQSSFRVLMSKSGKCIDTWI